MMAARAAEAACLEAARAAQAERDRTLASLNTRAALTEQCFAQMRSHYLAQRGNETDPGLRDFHQAAVNFIDVQVSPLIGQWRLLVTTEVGSTTELVPSKRFMTIERQACAALATHSGPAFALAPAIAALNAQREVIGRIIAIQHYLGEVEMTDVGNDEQLE